MYMGTIFSQCSWLNNVEILGRNEEMERADSNITFAAKQ